LLYILIFNANITFYIHINKLFSIFFSIYNILTSKTFRWLYKLIEKNTSSSHHR